MGKVFQRDWHFCKADEHPLTKLCEKLFDEHRLMDFHRCVLDVDYRKLLLNELAHN